MTAELTIYVDADACPVKTEVVKVAERHQLRVVLVANSWMQAPRGQRIRMQVVPGFFDAADDWIVEHVAQDDIVSRWLLVACMRAPGFLRRRGRSSPTTISAMRSLTAS